MLVPAPESITRKIAANAAVLAKNRAPRAKFNSKHGADSIRPVFREGIVGVGVPSQSHYMMYQEKGTKGHLQTELIGKTIPIRDGSGVIHFRKVTAQSVGRTVVARDANGNVTGTKLSWYHPGIKAKHFMFLSVRQAIKDWKTSLTKEDIVQITKEVKNMSEVTKYLGGDGLS